MGKNTAVKWYVETDEVVTGMADWRVAHPKATLKEIEEQLDVLFAKMKARMLAAAALESATNEAEYRAQCPSCGSEMESRGKRTRTLVTQHDQEVELERSYQVCPKCGFGIFPPG